MTAWWTYRPSDFLLFSARTYYRLFELYNAEVWPAHLLTLGLGLALWLALRQGHAWAPRAACALLAAAWLWLAWGFHWQRYATINWAATGFAAAFALQGVLLLGWAAFASGTRIVAQLAGPARSLGLFLLFFALAVQPTIGPLLGRPWTQAEVFGLAPDPTVLGSFGALLLVQSHIRRGAIAPRRMLTAWWLLWPIPLLWCAVTGTTLATMRAADALLMPIGGLLALLAAWHASAGQRPR